MVNLKLQSHIKKKEKYYNPRLQCTLIKLIGNGNRKSINRYQALRCSMSTLQPQGPPKSGHNNHTEEHQRPQRPTPPPQKKKALSTPSIHQRLEHMKGKHPHIHQCIPPQHTNARIGQRYAEAAHTDKSRAAKTIGQLQSPVAHEAHYQQ